uniref:Uncharacterized protein n=1 Tax=Serinus canaria TaxID=9135 RepID=A0A8C9UGN9_SERCA
ACFHSNLQYCEATWCSRPTLPEPTFCIKLTLSKISICIYKIFPHYIWMFLLPAADCDRKPQIQPRERCCFIGNTQVYNNGKRKLPSIFFFCRSYYFLSSSCFPSACTS